MISLGGFDDALLDSTLALKAATNEPSCRPRHHHVRIRLVTVVAKILASLSSSICA